MKERQSTPKREDGRYDDRRDGTPVVGQASLKVGPFSTEPKGDSK
jgi:hypothetical protein